MTNIPNTRKNLFLIFALAGAFSVGSLMAAAAMSSAPEKASENTSVKKAAAQQEKPFLDHDVVLGDPDAPIEIIEYASTTCSHCAEFHSNVLPELKAKYVDTGKAKIIFRHFMLNAIDLDASIISRCAAEEKYYPLLGLIFKRQGAWFQPQEYKKLADQYGKETGARMFSEQTRDEVAKIARMAGVSKARVDQCLANTQIRDYLIRVYQEGAQTYGITGTPTFILNGEKHEGGYSFESLDEALQDLM